MTSSEQTIRSALKRSPSLPRSAPYCRAQARSPTVRSVASRNVPARRPLCVDAPRPRTVARGGVGSGRAEPARRSCTGASSWITATSSSRFVAVLVLPVADASRSGSPCGAAPATRIGVQLVEREAEHAVAGGHDPVGRDQRAAAGAVQVREPRHLARPRRACRRPPPRRGRRRAARPRRRGAASRLRRRLLLGRGLALRAAGFLAGAAGAGSGSGSGAGAGTRRPPPTARIAAVPASPTSSSGRSVPDSASASAGKLPSAAAARSSATTVVSPPTGAGDGGDHGQRAAAGQVAARGQRAPRGGAGQVLEAVDQHDRVAAAGGHAAAGLDRLLDGLGLRVDGGGERQRGARRDRRSRRSPPGARRPARR